MSFLLFLIAQVGPSTMPLPTARLPERPLAKRATPAPAATCKDLVRSAPLQAIELADTQLRQVKGSAVVEPGECKALALSALERWSEAEAAFLFARDAVPANERGRRAMLGASAGISAEAGGNRARGLELLDAAHAEALNGADPVLAGKIALDRGGMLYALGRKPEAATALAEARAALPDNSDAWLISARFSRREGKLADAQTQIETAARLLPVDPDIGLEAGVIAVLSGRDEAARRSWQSVIAAAPDSPQAATARGYLAQLAIAPAQPAPGR